MTNTNQPRATIEYVQFDTDANTLTWSIRFIASGRRKVRINRNPPALSDLRAAFVATGEYDNAETVEIQTGRFVTCGRCDGMGHLGRGKGWHAFGTCFACNGNKTRWIRD